MSLTAIERFTLGDGIDLDIGSSIDTVTYIDRLNYLSPFARLTARVGPGTLDIGYSSGAPPVDLLNAREVDGSLLADVASLNLLPQVSLRAGHASGSAVGEFRSWLPTSDRKPDLQCRRLPRVCAECGADDVAIRQCLLRNRRPFAGDLLTRFSVQHRELQPCRVHSVGNAERRRKLLGDGSRWSRRCPHRPTAVNLPQTIRMSFDG